MDNLVIINALLQCWLKPAIAFAGILFFTRWSNARSPHVCHWLLLTLSVLVLVVMLVSSVLPAIPIAVFASSASSEFGLWLSRKIDFGWGIGSLVVGVALSVYLLVALFRLALHARDMWQAKNLIARAWPLSDQALNALPQAFQHYRFVETAELNTPVVWGAYKPVIALPLHWQLWQPQRLTRVVTHEVAHIQRHDFLIKNAMIFFAAIFWLIPLVATLVERALSYAEYACDDEVIKRGHKRADYAEDLLAFSSVKNLNSSFVAAASSELAHRLQLVLDGGRDRSEPHTVYKLAIVATAIICLLPLFSFSLSQQEQPVQFNEVKLNILWSAMPRVAVPNVLPETPNASSPARNTADISTPLRAPVTRVHSLAAVPPADRMHAGAVYASADSTTRTSDFTGRAIPLYKSASASVFDVRLQRPVLNTEGGTAKHMVMPEYPSNALMRGRESRVAVRFDINPQGRATNVRFGSDYHSSAKNAFEKSVQKALSASRFYPQEIHGELASILDVNEVFVFELVARDYAQRTRSF